MGTIDDELLARYAIHLADQRRHAASTVNTYLSDANAFQNWCREAGEDPAAMSREMYSLYITHLSPVTIVDGRVRPNPQGVERSTVARKVSALRSFYTFLVQEGWFKATPVPSGRTTSIKVPDALLSFLTYADVERLLEACTPRSLLEIRDRAILELTYAFGLQLSELHELDLDNVDLLHCTLTVVGKGGRERVLPFGHHAREWLMRYLMFVRPSLVKSHDDPALWLNVRGRRLSRKTLGGIPMRYATAAGLAGVVTLSTLRHSCGAHLLDGGAEPIVVAHILNLAAVASTKAYEKIATEERRRDYLEHHPLANGDNNHVPLRAIA